MRLFLLILLLAPWPGFAWVFTSDPICTLTHGNEQAEVWITHDPTVTEYRLDLILTGTEWTQSPRFGIAFAGPSGLTIGTDRHWISGRTLSVTDRGFGNVLNGLEFNRSARAFTDIQSVDFDLEGAADPVRQFRRCAEAAPPTS